MKKILIKIIKTKPVKILLRPSFLQQTTSLGRYMQRELTPRLARVLQKCFKVKKGKVVSFGSGGVSPIQYKLVKKHLREYEGIKNRRYHNYFGRSIISRLITIPYDLATSEVIIVEDVYRPIKYLKRNGNQLIVQTWHALGAFKKFGLANVDNLLRLEHEDNEELKIIHVYDYTLDPGIRFREKYLESFAPGCKILEGIFNPRVDLLFDEDYIEEKKEQLFDKYPQLRNKKILLYTPTYRGFSNRADAHHFMNFDELLSRLDDHFMLILKKHPSMKKSSYRPPSEQHADKFLDLSNENVNNLMLISDLLINDYSSTFFEFALLGKPVVFLAKDLDEYLDDRGFYFDFKTFVPGPICMTEAALYEEIRANIGNGARVRKFAAEYFGEVPKDNAKRFADFIVRFINRDGMEHAKLKRIPSDPDLEYEEHKPSG
ncbi:CDP-ribitol ribitolphosphotransferase [Melghirimyces profundicolus]|uniref:CDP-ribitol ribitolphosphotransferase n=1 Tax=Melghirimyces profundicolus TaxID=1242148 RepID=A0A2T6C0P2_9BACL|nr:CDP-glycerol glycerophosphotransferase family protein [Melghirimyces profundicolus]PTX61807.1 CDP-ribitol ribitolphosphotransferase [Melghirimyces profundicolus]